jgi:putative peptidoglycan lipid II flippase
MSKKIRTSIAGATLFLIFVSIFSKGIGFFREVIYASEFGLSDEYDLYLVTAVIPIVISTIIFYIGQNYFIPRYNTIKNSSGDTVEFFQWNFWFFVISGTIITAILVLFSEDILRFYIGDPFLKNRDLTLNIFYLFLFTLPLASGSAIFSAYLNAEFEFRVPALSQLFLNILVVLAVITFSGTFFIYSIPLGFIAGTFVQFFYLLIYIKNNSREIKFFKFRAIPWRLKTDRGVFYILVIEIIGQFYLLVDRWFYLSVDKGGIAALNYANTLFYLPISLISLSFSSVLLPYFSNKYSAEGKIAFNEKILESLKINNIIFVPLLVLFLIFGPELIKLIFERGKFNSSDTILTGEVLRVFAMGLVFFSGYSILNKALFAAGKVKLLLYLSILGVLLKIILSYVLVGDFSQNGLALSTVAAYAFFFFVSLIILFWGSGTILSYILHLFYYSITAFFIFLLSNILKEILPAANLISDLLLMIFFIAAFLVSAYILDYAFITKLLSFRQTKEILKAAPEV